MEQALNNIITRVHKEENKDRYNHLILHTSEVPEGERFIKWTEYAREMWDKRSDENCLLEYQKTIHKLTAWLDENGWA